MFKINVGKTDRLLRILLGAALLVAFAIYGSADYGWLLLIGIIPLATGLISSCPLYSIFGISSCRLEKSDETKT